MKKINFKDGELVKGAYVTINDEEIPVTEAEYTGDTPLSSHVMNKLQDNIESELNSSKTLQGEQIIIENACSCNSNLKIYGKTIQATGIPTPTSPIEIKNVTNLNFIKENEDGTVSETINFPFTEGQMLHEGDYIDEEGIHQQTGTITKFIEQQKIAYDKLRLMYEGYNKITCTDEIKPILDITYYYNNDLNKTYAGRLDKVENKFENLEKNIITATINSKFTIKSTELEKLILKHVTKIGNKLNIKDGNIVIGENVKYIKVFAQVEFFDKLTSGKKNIQINKNDLPVGVSTSNIIASYSTINLAGIVVEVKEGDNISLYIKGAINDTIFAGNTATFITVETV